MKLDSGAPAFENVDELLADRIVKHSRRHSEQTDVRTAPLPEQHRPAAGAVPQKARDENSGLLIIAAAVAALVMLLLLYRLLVRKAA